MKRYTLFLALFTLVSAQFAAAQQPPEMPRPTPAHEWLQQLVGEWETKSECTMFPDQPAMECSGTINTTKLGGFWVVSRWDGDAMGTPMKGLQTIGYDPRAKKYVGTWIDSMTDHIWKYEGNVDKAGTTLTLEAEGPDFMRPDNTTLYRDVYEFKSPDEIAVSTLMRDESGNWVTFMSGTSTRKN